MKKIVLFALVGLVGLLFSTPAGVMGSEAELLPQAPVDWRFGIVETYEDPAAANASGAAWTRVRFQWAEVQAGGEGTWTHPTVTDAQIANEAASGRRVVGLLIGIPNWANENGLPRGLYAPIDDPANTWATFVRTSVGRYNGTINNWIIWNEPDVWDKNAPGHTWDGSVEDFVQLQKVAYLVAKQTNPNATIHLSAFTWFWDANYGKEQYMGRMLDVIMQDPSAADNNYYFDVATAHLYFQPEMVYNIIGGFYGIMNSRGIFKPIWVVETNAPPSSDPAWPVPNLTFNVTLEEQARYMPQVMAVGLAAGAQRIAIYKMKDKDSDVGANPEPFGLVRRDGSRRPAFNSYRVAVGYMAGVQSAKRLRWDDVGVIKLNQEGRSTHVMFTRTQGDRFVQVEATAPIAILADMYGVRQSLTAENGFFGVNLPAANCTQIAGEYCMIGGHTYYLVQGVDGSDVAAPAAQEESAPTSDETATPEATATDTPEPTATPTDTLTPTPVPTNTPVPTATPIPTNTLRPTLAVFATAVAEPTNADQVALGDESADGAAIELPDVRRPWISTGDLFGYGMILVGLGILWRVFVERRKR